MSVRILVVLFQVIFSPTLKNKEANEEIKLVKLE